MLIKKSHVFTLWFFKELGEGIINPKDLKVAIREQKLQKNCQDLGVSVIAPLVDVGADNDNCPYEEYTSEGVVTYHNRRLHIGGFKRIIIYQGAL